MLFGTILLWALNVTVSRYILTHGLRPLAYGTLRYGAAVVLFWGFTWQRERSFRIAISDRKLVGAAAALLFVNQLCFVSSVHLTNASTVALMLGATPIFAGIIASLVGIEQLRAGFWIAALLALAGVGCVAGGGPSGDVVGDTLAVGTAATWAAYSVAIVPLMRRYSPLRISTLVFAVAWLPLALVSIPDLLAQGYSTVSWTLAVSFVYAVVGPLFLTNILWFTAISRVGASRATLFTTIQPLFAVLFAVVLLSEHLNGWEIAGGAAIGVGIVVERLCGQRPLAAGE